MSQANVSPAAAVAPANGTPTKADSAKKKSDKVCRCSNVAYTRFVYKCWSGRCGRLQ